VLAFIILFFAVVRYIAQRNLKEKILRLEKEQAIEKERNRIARDMHDDLGSGLTKIAILSEVVKTQLQQPDKAREQLENISVSSRELVDNMQDIIWVLNPKNDTLESLASYLREYALKFFEPFETKVQFKYPEEIPAVKLTEEQRRNIFLIIKESFNNIAKHAECSRVILQLEKINMQINFMIEDDGKGFNSSNTRAFGNGLQNMKNRMEQINGYYIIHSQPGKGTVTRISFTL
jgi:signal transduction histidine kinase